ncbi:hypothetical protein [Amphibacillus indicireducens]|uniref:Pilus assembly protein PilO n=1 Tax=Amphibacillus indicireducens TaxID=1076330 RepID=A0ABP7VHX7_9BACI
MIKWNRTYTLLSILVVLFLIFIWYYSQLYLLEPARESIRESESTLADQQVLIDLADSGALSREAIQAEADSIQVHLPAEKNVDQIITDLRDIESDTGVVLQLISLANDALNTEEAYYPNEIGNIRYQINFTAETFDEFELFISELNSQVRSVEIDHLSIQQTSTDGVTGSLAIRYFYHDRVNFN